MALASTGSLVSFAISIALLIASKWLGNEFDLQGTRGGRLIGEDSDNEEVDAGFPGSTDALRTAEDAWPSCCRINTTSAFLNV